MEGGCFSKWARDRATPLRTKRHGGHQTRGRRERHDVTNAPTQHLRGSRVHVPVQASEPLGCFFLLGLRSGDSLEESQWPRGSGSRAHDSGLCHRQPFQPPGISCPVAQCPAFSGDQGIATTGRSPEGPPRDGGPGLVVVLPQSSSSSRRRPGQDSELGPRGRGLSASLFLNK